MLRHLATTLATTALTVLAAAPALAQCDKWIDSPSFHAPLQTHARAVTVYTPPGSNPRVIVAGSKVMYQGQDLNDIAQWDGLNWLPLGSGVDGYVEDVTVWNSPAGPRLIAAGHFYVAGGVAAKSLAQWNGTAWAPVGGGITHADTGGAADVTAVTTWDPDGAGAQPEQLVVAGRFTRAGSVNVNNIARWDGTTWRPLSLGIDYGVQRLTTWDPDGAGPINAQVIAAGYVRDASNVIVNGVCRFDGGSWRNLGTGLSNANDPANSVTVESVTSYDPDGPGPITTRVVVAGRFTHAGGNPAAGLAMYGDGAWTALGTAPGAYYYGVGTWDPDGPAGPTLPRLVASGHNQTVNNNNLPTPAWWNGSVWTKVGAFGDNPWLERFVDWDPDGAGAVPPRLVAVGLVGENLPGGGASGIMQLLNDQWAPFSPSAPQVFASAPFNGRVVMGGVFQMPSYNRADPTGPGVDAWNIADWQGYATFKVTTITGTVRALKSYVVGGPAGDPELVVGGTFGGAGGIMVSNVVRYREGIFVGNNGWFAMGQGFNGTVYAIERFNNNTYAAGTFTASGATTLNNIARFDNTNWQPLTSGGITGVNGPCYALKVYNGFLYAGGSFTAAGGLASGGLARWNGTTWSIVGGFFQGTVHALHVHNNELIIGGLFPGLSGSPNLAKFNGTTYSTIGTGGSNNTIRALATGPDGRLYVGGDFSNLGGGHARCIGAWNGSTWDGVRSGVDGPVYTITPYRNELHVGGLFTRAGFPYIPAAAWARFTVDNIPWIVGQPDDDAACVGDDVESYLGTALGYWPLTATLRRNGATIASGPTPWGSTIEYAGPVGIRIGNAQPQDTATYDAYIATSCGGVFTQPFRLIVNSPDFNNDGDYGTDADIEAFFACLGGNCCPTCGSADFNADGDVGTDADIEAFFRVLGGGAC